MIIFIKNMVCTRCTLAVENVFKNLDIPYTSVETGRAEITGELTEQQYTSLNSALQYYELELIENKKTILVERIKNLIIKMVHSEDNEPPLKFTAYLTRAMGYDYTYLSNVFSESEGSTIEKFYILNRIERVKELIVYEDLTITEIAFKMNYSSVSHLCLQFKKVTGETPTSFKKLCRLPGYAWKKL